MQGLGSLLDFHHSALLVKIWDVLEVDCGLRGIRTTPIPHFSWHVAEDYQCDALKFILQEVVAQVEPFSVQTTGLAFFSGESPIAYIPIVRTRALSDFHEILWSRVTPISLNPNLYYSPRHWMPHITVAISDLDRQNLPCLVEKLAFQEFDWQIAVDNIGLACQENEQIAYTKMEFKLGKTG